MRCFINWTPAARTDLSPSQPRSHRTRVPLASTVNTILIIRCSCSSIASLHACLCSTIVQTYSTPCQHSEIHYWQTLFLFYIFCAPLYFKFCSFVLLLKNLLSLIQEYSFSFLSTFHTVLCRLPIQLRWYNYVFIQALLL